ncbi:MAG: APC family permease [Mycobacterium leprae]
MASRKPAHRLLSGPSYLYIDKLKRLLYGAPKRTDQQDHERLDVFFGLAVFSSDALSSVAYATEEILLVLMAAGAAATAYSLPVGLAIVALVLIVAASYNQTIKAYPNGGGAYIVAKENLGVNFGLLAGAALLADYILTVAVSTAAGIAAVTSAIPALRGHEVALCLLAVWFMAWMNLRGVRESGKFVAFPAYAFITAMVVLIGGGVYRAATGMWHPIVSIAAPFHMGGDLNSFKALTNDVTLYLILRAFASGCTALSGIEAVANGVQAFRSPEPENAMRTLGWSRTILFTVFGGITLLAFGFGALPVPGKETLLSVMGRQIFGTGPIYYFIQITTMAILLLAANTAYAGFPRLASMMAADGFLPRKMANLGDTLVLNAGVYLLAFLASVLLVAFRGSTHLLIPLYSVGVFMAFTLSQTGMVRHWLRVAKQAGESLGRHARAIFINSLGAILSGIAVVVTVVAKFTQGAWIIVVVVPLLMFYFYYVHNYYKLFKDRVESLQGRHLSIDDAKKQKVIVTIGGLTPVIDHVMKVAHQFSDDITAVYVAVDPEQGQKIARKWDLKRHGGVQLEVIPSPLRRVVPPLRKYLDQLHKENPGVLINLLVPVIVTNDAFDTYLHNGTADLLLRELRYSEGILMTVIPFYVNMDPDAASPIAEAPPVSSD